MGCVSKLGFYQIVSRLLLISGRNAIEEKSLVIRK